MPRKAILVLLTLISAAHEVFAGVRTDELKSYDCVLNAFHHFARNRSFKDNDPYTGYNSQLKTLRFAEGDQTLGSPNGNRMGSIEATIDEFVQTDRYLSDHASGGWWIPSSFYGTRITRETSRSFAKTFNGKELATREIFWPKTAWQNSSPALDKFRIALNKDAVGNPLTLELFVKKYGRWRPFMYERKGNLWVPISEIKGMPLKDFCKKCHVNKLGGLSPKPYFLKTRQDFLDVGYHDEPPYHVIEYLQKF